MTKILAIEDEKTHQINLHKVLSMEGFEVIIADNGNRGVDLALQEQPDLIICDIMMPELDGYKVLKALQQNPITASIPFIFISAKSDPTDMRIGMNLGADDYLPKPFSREEILSAIATRLQKQLSLKKQHTQEMMQTEAIVKYLLRYDRETNLPNRFLLTEKFQELIAQNEAIRQPIPVLALGIETLKQLHDTLGPATCHPLLESIAARLTNRLGWEDTIARIGFDRFIIILATKYQIPEISQVAEDLLDALSSPFPMGDHQISLSPRIGIALFGRDGLDLDTLIQHASAAMEDGQDTGKQRYQFYIASIGDKSQAALLLEQELRQGIERAEFQLYYQPKVNLLTGQIEGAEALVRWRHPQRGFVSPGEFIPLAEKTGLIVPLGEWVLKAACTQAKIWQDVGFAPLRIAVNLSGHQFNRVHLDRLVLDILRETGLDPSYLELELTESALIENPDAAIATLHQLRSLGIRISIDDFGTGYSSLSYLSQFPFDVLKIDRSFICQLPEDEKNLTITTAILQMAHRLKLKIVAEGVETKNQLIFLQEHQCDEIQGYWFSPPLSSQDFTDLLHSGKSLPLLSASG
ncbi:MAG TPA: GGDEF domain-containing response regulator [Cyanobacteria bacterium UBA11149]|nr:GGDEF domain-containing response regulator [Cyanobacteria bacterium UBA11367]HBE60305.1 GGDEF domain-containing response regulator [Cyanobacteria bacterium UBA11366]HBK66990.1 GGDEF domain-containing response regulator [Cyanobacteria bacterium UBA11166]HBR74413.1 GGDEF domain-containing response regulator [Cyanobacteria bacterium UBA11159]HBS68813.1 GGDEF domain-containing response regulator [Cyanobacteria bacterium UBA11153]HBW92398.1 GGDEF domain-containing response regulator [Cyanobacter